MRDSAFFLRVAVAVAGLVMAGLIHWTVGVSALAAEPASGSPRTGPVIESIPKAMGGEGRTTVLLTNQKNIVFGEPDPNDFTADERAIISGLKFSEIGIPEHRAYTFFNLYVAIDNQTSRGVIEKQLSVDVRVLCVDADGKDNVTATTNKAITLGVKGPQYVELEGRTLNHTIRLRNNGETIPKNAYVAFKLNGKVFREVLLAEYGEKEWWLKEELVKGKDEG